MKRFVAISFLSAFLVACGGNDTQKFIGEWIDPDPDEPISLFGGPGIEVDNDDVLIEDAGNNNLFVTVMIHGKPNKRTLTANKNTLVDQRGRAQFELVNGKLHYLSPNKMLDKKG